MKKLSLILVLISSLTFGQMENYVINDNQVQWQKVYETTKTFDELLTLIKIKNNIKITEVAENTLVGEFSDVIMNTKKAGFSYLNTPFVLDESNKYSGIIRIEYKEGKYRATIRNVKSKGRSMTLYGGGLGLGSNLDTSLEQMALNNKGEIRKSFPKVAGKIVDVTFIDLMDFTKTPVTDDSW